MLYKIATFTVPVKQSWIITKYGEVCYDPVIVFSTAGNHQYKVGLPLCRSKTICVPSRSNRPIIRLCVRSLRVRFMIVSRNDSGSRWIPAVINRSRNRCRRGGTYPKSWTKLPLDGHVCGPFLAQIGENGISIVNAVLYQIIRDILCPACISRKKE